MWRYLGITDYLPTWNAMRRFTAERTPDTPDEIWLTEHPPVFTQGQAGKPEHILNAQDIPIIYSDRGGQVTYHGPGQLLMYVLLDLKRQHASIRTLVTLLEASVIHLLSEYQIIGARRHNAPGIYVNHHKIAALGLRVRKGYVYHGLSLNLHMDLEPFSRINPCGDHTLKITQLSDWIGSTQASSQIIGPQLAQLFQQHWYKN
jgi:lipoyl(octanoyl) transferase